MGGSLLERANPTAEALLLFEDSDITKRRAILDTRGTPSTTGDFLRALESAGLIQSTDEILNRATAQGRNTDRQRAGVDSEAGQRLRDELPERRDQHR